jgi:hypothetical protein
MHMRELTSEGWKRIEELAQRYSTSAGAALALLRALAVGGGTMAQFNHPDLGGMGQWSQGGMIMVGDMFNNALKAKVSGLCTELVGLLIDRSNWKALDDPPSSGDRPEGDSFGEASLFIPTTSARSAHWWGADLGQPSSTGAQNATRYAYFPRTRRLAIEIGGVVTFYDTGDHQIGGVSQQQSGDASLTFTSQHGLVRVSDLQVIQIDSGRQARAEDSTNVRRDTVADRYGQDGIPAGEAAVDAAPAEGETGLTPSSKKSGLSTETDQSTDILMLIERLAALREKNVLSEEEFSVKKAELLARL